MKIRSPLGKSCLLGLSKLLSTLETTKLFSMLPMCTDVTEGMTGTEVRPPTVQILKTEREEYTKYEF